MKVRRRRQSIETVELALRYPRRIALDHLEIELDLMSRADAAPLLEFVQSLPMHDLLFLRQDITQPAVMKAWIGAIENGTMFNLMALHQGRLVGCCAVVRDEASWSAHVGELRVVVGDPMRGHGLGRHLITEAQALALALGLSKLQAHMTTDQRATLLMFEDMGFHAEALLAGHVRDPHGRLRDIAVLARRIDEQSKGPPPPTGAEDPFERS